MWKVELETACVAFTDRRGGESAPPYDSLNLGVYTRDDPARVAGNIERVRDKLGLTSIVCARQTHGSELVSAERLADPGEIEGDGLHAQAAGVGLMVTVADCLPVALAGDGRVAMVHCGWRGMAGGIVERALDRFGHGTPTAVIGPGIGRDVYEVGPEVPRQIGADAHGHYTDGCLDLRGVAIKKLRDGGVRQIESVDVCTFGSPELLFSHRRDGETGRQAGIAWLH